MKRILTMLIAAMLLSACGGTEAYAIALAKDNEELLEKINTALDELTADGTIQGIIDKYITAE